jgi:hypothetical protein
MMSYATRYRVNGSRVIQETFENEVIVVNLDSGRYYCLQQSGAEAWTLLLAGMSANEVAAVLSERYEASIEDIAPAIERLCGELVAEALIVADADLQASSRSAGEAADGRRPFTPPTLQIYSDMQDLLLLDPIHEVDPSGWPAARREEPGPPQ